jgi:hypothetical protein
MRPRQREQTAKISAEHDEYWRRYSLDESAPL